MSAGCARVAFGFVTACAATALAQAQEPAALSPGQKAAICNRQVEVTHVRDVPGTQHFKVVAQVRNGTAVSVIDVLTNASGARYAFVELFDQQGQSTGRGFVQENVLVSPFCPSQFMPDAAQAEAEPAPPPSPPPARRNRDQAWLSIGPILLSPPPAKPGWKVSIDEQTAEARVDYRDASAKAPLQLSYACGTNADEQALVLRMKASLATKLFGEAENVWVVMTEDRGGEAVRSDGTVEKFTSSTLVSEWFVVRDPADDKSVLLVSYDDERARPDRTNSDLFARAHKQTIVKLVDGSMKDIEALKAKPLLTQVFPAKGSTQAFARAYEYCGLDFTTK